MITVSRTSVAIGVIKIIFHLLIRKICYHICLSYEKKFNIKFDYSLTAFDAAERNFLV